MRLIAKKPCSFNGQQFFIGDEIPVSLVADAKLQEKYGVLTIANGEASDDESGASDTLVAITAGDTEVQATPEEIQQVFSIMQLTAEEGAKAIAEVNSENVLILLNAADSRKSVKNAAKERVDNLFSTEDSSNEATGGNETTDTDTEGADT